MSQNPYDFDWFQPKTAVRIYRGNLPHWRQSNCLYFVTFRLGDAVPNKLKLQWIDDNRRWLDAHQVNGYPENPAWRNALSKRPQSEQIAFRHMNQHRLFDALDEGYGACLLEHPKNRAIIEAALMHFDDGRYRSGDFVIMPNHVHWLVQPRPDYRLEDILHSIKRFTARRINQQSNQTGALWQKSFYDHIVRDEKELSHIRNYIADNPSKAHREESCYTCHHANWLD